MSGNDLIERLKTLQTHLQLGDSSDCEDADLVKEAIAALEAAPVWVKCSERMPEITTKKHGMNVLAATQCICGDYEYCMDWFIDGAIYAKDGAWAFWNMDSPPTHWMPLPSPPLVDQEG
jgi:hypothetical protein